MQLKTIQDYYDQICEMYPTVPKKDIKRILQFGWKSFYLHNSYGGDVLISQQNFWCYCGQLMNDSLKYFAYYKSKIRVKLRVLYKRKKIQWDGYYYFALTKKQYEQYLNSKNKRGRPRKNFQFDKIFLYKIFDECNIMQYNRVAIFRIPLIEDIGFVYYKEKIITDKAELVLVRNPLSFKDILTSKYNYQYL